MIVEGFESRDILNCSSILWIYDFPFVIVWIWFLFWLISLILSLSNLSCISFNIVCVGVASCIFDFATFIGIIKGCFKDWADDDDDKVEEKIDFDVSPTSLPRQKKTKIEKFLLFVDLNVEVNDLYNLIVFVYLCFSVFLSWRDCLIVVELV